VNGPASRFANGWAALTNAATFSLAPARPAAAAEVEPTSLPARVVRDHAVQIGSFPAEHTAWQIAEDSTRFAPDGQPRVQPAVFRRHTLYHAQLVGLSEAEARTVCANFSRRVASCQVFRIGMGPSAQR
jgi:hypothetical protein